MQEDKEAVFDTVDTLSVCLRVAAVVLDNATVNETKTRKAASTGYLNATELADSLVRQGIPFRVAHEAAGKAVVYAIGQKKELDQLRIDEIRQFADAADEDTLAALSLERTVAAKSAIGGTSPERVRQELAAAREKIDELNLDE
jgi:argininosuccinate lyase